MLYDLQTGKGPLQNSGHFAVMMRERIECHLKHIILPCPEPDLEPSKSWCFGSEAYIALWDRPPPTKRVTFLRYVCSHQGSVAGIQDASLLRAASLHEPWSKLLISGLYRIVQRAL